MSTVEQPNILAIPSPISLGAVIKVLESPGADPSAVVDRVLSGRYEKPFVVDDGHSRQLYFSFAFVQSAMRVSQPNALELTYTQKMMSFVLFQPHPERILMLGLGGGSLAKFCHAMFPQADITVVEINSDVVAFRNEFRIPPDSERFRVILGDAADYVAACGETFDVIVTDAFDRDGFADSVCTRDFYGNLQRRLTPRGLLVSNMAGRHAEQMAHLNLLQDLFIGRTLAIPVGASENHVAISFNDPDFKPRWPMVRCDAKLLGKTLGLDLLKFARKFEQSHDRDYLKRSLEFFSAD